MKKILFGIALILFSIFVLMLNISYNYSLPAIVEYIYVFLPLIGLVFCFIGLSEKDK